MAEMEVVQHFAVGKQVSGRMEDEEVPSSSVEISDRRDSRKRPLGDAEELSPGICAKCPRGSQEPSVGGEDETDKYKELHKAIKEGDLKLVKSLIQNDTEEKQFCYEETSALCKACNCEQHEIIAYLFHKDAKFVGSEAEYTRMDLSRVNPLLMENSKKTEKSCVYWLISQSKCRQGLDGKHLDALKSLFEDLFESEIIKLLMNVLETVPIDIVYDFESETVNCIYRQNVEEAELYGLTRSNAKEIFIGAKNLLSSDPRKKAKVYGVVAEELCHLALTTMFRNYAKPYEKGDSELNQEFCDIVKAVKCLSDRSCHIESVIKDVFANYDHYAMECELIARIPHLIGIYGEQFGRQIFQESPELSRLLSFYKQNVLLKCKEYTDPSLNTKSHRMIEQLRMKTDFISCEEKQTQPLKEKFPSFRDYLVNEEGVFIISTNCTKLCTLHVYHDLRREYRHLVEKKCVFFSSKCFEMNCDEIVDALKGNVWKFMILVVDEKEISMQTLKCEFLDHFECLNNQKLEIIIITSSQSLGQKFKPKAVNYSWNDLSDEYKRLRTHSMEYVFKGGKECIDVKTEDVPQHFTEAEIIKIMNGELFEVVGGTEGDCQGYNSETYIERKFKAMTVAQSIFQDLPPDTSTFIYGPCKLKELAIDGKKVQFLYRADDEIQKGKCIFISDDKTAVTFENFLRKTPNKSRVCLYYSNKVFYQQKLHSKGDNFKEHKRQKELTEEEVIDLLECSKVLIITENAGYGKSTVTSSLIKKLNISPSWVFRVNLNAISWDCIQGNCKDALLGLNNFVDKYHFRKCCERGCCYVFFDGYDEIPLKYRSEALKLISEFNGNKGVKMVITTRGNLAEKLEEKLNCFSLQLVSFSKKNQLNYLEKLWNWKLKFPNGEQEKDKIAELDFKKLAKSVLNNTPLFKKRSIFMGIPLNLYMTGIIHLNSNFELNLQSDIYFLYSTFMEQKFEIYLKEKLQLRHNGSHVMDYIVEKIRKKAFGIHFHLANQLMQKEKDDSQMNELEKELFSGLGIVFFDGGKTQFLHQTFAEFMFAESVRKNIEKKVLRKILFQVKYDVVRRFLSSALEKKDFEGLTVNFFKDVKFFVTLMERIIDDEISGKCKSFSDRIHTLKIVRKLLESFEAIDGKKELVDRFQEGLNSLIMDKGGGKDGNLWFPMRFASCLTIDMIRNLIRRNSMVNSIMVLNIVRSSENIDKVIEVVKECVSMKGGGECGSVSGETESKRSDSKGLYDNKSVLGMMQSERSDSVDLSDNRSVVGVMENFPNLTELLKIEDSNGKGLLFHALWNDCVETFANLLKFPCKVLGKERFQKVVIESNEYRKQMKEFIKKVSLNKICAAFEAVQSVFGAEMEILFDEESKMNVIHKSVRKDGVPVSNNPFDKVKSLFTRCFGGERMKELLLSPDCNGDYLIHILFNRCAIKTVEEYLKLIGSILEDRSEMKLFLNRKNGDLRNVFHLAVVKDKNLKNVIKLCGPWLGNDEVKEMVQSVDKFGKSVINVAECKRSTRKSEKNLQTLRDIVGGDD